MSTLIGLGQRAGLREIARGTTLIVSPDGCPRVRLAALINENITLNMQYLHGTAESRT
jgi:hypothetical protein